MIMQFLLGGVLVPAIVGFALMFLLWRRPGRRNDKGPLWAGALVLCLSFLTAWLIVRGLPDWPVRESLNWLPYLAIGGLLAGLLCSLQKLPLPTIAALRLLVSVIAVWLSTQSLQKHTWEGQSWIWLAGLSLLMYAVWTSWEYVSSRSKGSLAPLLLAAFFMILAIAALLGRNAVSGQNATMICAVFGAMFILALIKPSLDLSQATLFVAMPLFANLLISCHFYAYLDTLGALLVLACSLAAPLALIATDRLATAPKLITAVLITVMPFLPYIGKSFIQGG